MAVNKVEVGGETKLDLTADTVTPETLLKGATAHNAAGEAITGTLEAGGGAASESDITFYDYEGTIVESWTLAELANKTELPAYPSHEGLICQGWNWSLADLKATNRKMNVGAMYITDDGKTRIYIHLEEGRTSPMLGVCPKGTVTVDWGDGTTPDTLTGTSTSTVKWTPTHNYATPGDYVIKLTVSGTMGVSGDLSGIYRQSAILRYSSGSDKRNRGYQRCVRRVEVGTGVVTFSSGAFYECASLASITIPAGVTRLDSFGYCASLASITIPAGVTRLDSFSRCGSLTSIAIPASVTSISTSSLSSCASLASITIPASVTSIGDSGFQTCCSLTSIAIPTSVTSIGSSGFYSCDSLASITIPASVTSIKSSTFYQCFSVAFYDFSNHATVPTLANTNAFTDMAADCEIRVPAALVDEWKAATNWATYADHIVGV